ncbi:hypothetical protein GCM10029978_065030 [Actinoallomurus acanthiterrae]
MELHVNHETLRTWVRAAEVAGRLGAVEESAKDAELARLCKEVAELKLEREILRKAAAFSPRSWIGDQPLWVHLRPPRRLRRQAPVPDLECLPVGFLPVAPVPQAVPDLSRCQKMTRQSDRAGSGRYLHIAPSIARTLADAS